MPMVTNGLNHLILRPLVQICNLLRGGAKKLIFASLKRIALVFFAFFSVALWTMPASAAPFAYVTNLGSGTVSVIDSATNTMVTNVTVGTNPAGVAVTPDGAFAYVANYGSDTVSVIATATNTVVTDVTVGRNPWGVAITPNGAFAYVTNYGSDTVSVIATATNTVVTDVTVGANPAGMAITPNGSLAYVASVGSHTVSVIATATNTVVATVPVGGGSYPQGVAITPDGGFAYIGINNWAFNVSVIATATNTWVSTIELGYAIDPLGVAITPDGAYAYVTTCGYLGCNGYNAVEVIATATNTVVATIPLPGVSYGLAITPDGAFAYVPNYSSNIVSMIATATNTVVGTIPVGDNPFWVAFTPTKPNLCGNTLKTSCSYEFSLEQGAQKNQSIQLINPGTVSRSAMLKIVNPHPELAISLQTQNPLTIAPRATVTLPLQTNAASAAVGVYDGILLEIAIDDGSTLYSNITVHVTEPGAAALPDLTVSSEDISSVGGNYVVTIHNRGNAPASQVTVQFSDFGESFGKTVIPEVPSNGNATTSITVPASPPGEQLIEVVINSPNSTTYKKASRIFHPSGPTEGNILVRGDLPPQVCPSSLFSVGGVAVYDLTLNGVKNTDYAVKGGSVQITTSGPTLYGDIHTDVNGAFSRFLLAPASPGSYSVTMTVTDTTFSGTGQFVFEVVGEDKCPPGEGMMPPVPPPVDFSLDIDWKYVFDQTLQLWKWVCSGDNCQLVPAQDVFVYSEHMAFSNTHPNPNEQITIGAQIQYFATDPALSSGKVQVNFYASTPGSPRVVLPPWVIDSIPARSSRNAFTTWKAPTDGIYIIEAEAVPTLVENTLNNAATRALIVGQYESGKGAISGQVRTNSGGVRGVTVSISATNSTVTDATGFYYIEHVPVGDYQVKISGVPAGYLADAETKTTQVTDQSVSTVDFHLTKQTGDTTPPALNLPDAITAEATGPSGAVVTYAVSATDNVDGEVTPACVPTSGSTFPLGVTTVTCTAVDKAENKATGSFTVTIRDITPPTIIAAATTSANSNGWYRSNVTIHFTCSDAGSGIAPGACPADEVLSAEGSTVSSTVRTVTDLAGNTSAPSNIVTAKIDKTPPIITGSASSAANAYGWNNKAVTVSFTCNDATAGIAACTVPQTLGGEGANQSVSGTATDQAGNTTSTQVTGINIDLTAPVVSVTGVTNGASYTLGSVPAAGCVTTDALSEVQTSATLSVTGGNSDGTGTFTASCTGAMDKAGNLGGAASVTYQVSGLVGPVITGALTIAFWQSKSGQALITGGASTSGVCNSGTWLRQYAPYQDLNARANCSQVTKYVTNIIKAANARGVSMNAMLKAQLLATALDVYFSDSALGGNKIAAPVSIGGVSIDLAKVCRMIDSASGTATCSGTYQNVTSAFGGATSLPIWQLLAYAASQSNVGGSSWYGNAKATQQLAKDTFDAINNRTAFAP